jgi:hypothetical protein
MGIFDDRPIKGDLPKHLRVYKKLDSDEQMKKLTHYQGLAPFEQSLSIPSKTYKNCYGEEFFIASIKCRVYLNKRDFNKEPEDY